MIQAGAGSGDTFWQRRFPALLLAVWVLTPEVRRLIDWQIGFNSLSIISIVPIGVMLPLIGMFFVRNRPAIAREFWLVMCLWLGAFGYSLLVGFLSGSLFGAFYELSLFCVPLLVGIWVAAMDRATALRVFGRFATAALWLAVFTSVYGIYQFVAPPAWDVAWVYNSELGSIGKPEPFGLRIFGTMNSPGVLSDFLAMAILLTLHRLNGKKVWLVIPLIICTAALVLTFGRTGWLELAVGFIVYVGLSPRRGSAIAMVSVTALLTLILGANLSLITGDASSNTQLSSRLSTFNDLQNDESANDRARQTSVALRQALAEPLGQGLGTVGTATKLGASQATTVLDNGYLTRFLEMGVFGFLLYLASLVCGLLVALAKIRPVATAKKGVDEVAPLVATAIAIQVALIGADLSGDHHASLMAIMFWVVVALSSKVREGVPAVDAFAGAGPEPNLRRPARA